MPPPPVPRAVAPSLNDDLDDDLDDKFDWEQQLADAETRASDAEAKVENLYQASMEAEKHHELVRARLQGYVDDGKQQVQGLKKALNTVVQQANTLISGVEMAQAKGAFTLSEAASIWSAIAVMKSAVQETKKK